MTQIISVCMESKPNLSERSLQSRLFPYSTEANKSTSPNQCKDGIED